MDDVSRDAADAPPSAIWLNEQFRLCVETLLDCFGVFSSVRDAQGRIVEFRIDYLNEAACRNNGRSLAEQVGRGVLELMPVHIETGLVAAYVDVVERGVPFQRVMQLVPGEGSSPVRWFDIRATRLRDGFVAAWRDVTERVREAEASRWHEALFRRLAESNTIGIGVGRGNGEALYVNDEMLRMMGYSRADFDAGRVDWAASLSPTSLAEAKASLPSLRRDGADAGYEREFVRPDGGTTPFVGAAALMPDGDTHVSIALDVSERRRREEESRRIQETFSHIIRNNPFGVYLVDADFRLREISVGARKVFAGIDPLLGRDFAEILRTVWPEPFASEAIAHFRHTLETGEPYVSLSTIEHRANVDAIEAYDWRVERIGLPDGRDGVVCYFYDLSERQRLEAALRDSEARLRLAQEAGGLGIHDFDPSSGRIDWDARVRELWGVDEGVEITYEVFLAGVHPDDRDATARAVAAALDPAGPGRFFCEYRVVNAKDGLTRWIAATGRVAFAGSRPVRLIGTVQDVSAIKQADAALREADRRKDEFLATLAHELRNPLAPIRQAAAVGQLPSATPAQMRWGFEVIARQADRMALLLNDLMDVSRITRGRIELDCVQVSLREVIDAAVETVGPLIESRRHALLVDVPHDGFRLMADPLRLSQIVSNLLANAAKYTHPGGAIRLSAAREGDAIRLAVADNGVGIAPHHLETVFEMFAQDASAGSHGEGGLGIGLALARALVELHGGTLTASSAGKGKGAEFVIRLPAEVKAPREHAEYVPAPAVPRRRVLVVDDNVDAAESLAMLLRLNGHETHVTYNGFSGLDAASRVRPEAVMVDLGMPGMDGLQFARHLRRMEGGNAMTLIAVTGWGQPEIRERTLQAGFDHHVTKPLDPQTLGTLLAATRTSNAAPS
jgi:PAS domain S-box-containing protein